MILPINGHILIEPIKHDSFTVSQQESYQEIGIVVRVDEYLEDVVENVGLIPEEGDKVYFDSWLAAKFPSGDPENPYWMVKYEDIRAIESKSEDAEQE